MSGRRRRALGTVSLAIASACLLAALVFAHTDLFLYRFESGGRLRVNLRVFGPLMGAGAALLVFALLELRRLFAFVRSRRSLDVLRLGLGIVAALAIALFVNLISARRYARFDLTASGVHTISERTREVLRHLEAPVTAYVFVRPAHPWFPTLQGLLDSYHEVARERFEVRYLHPGRDLATFERTARALGIEPRDLSGTDVVILAAPPLEGTLPRTRHVPLRAMTSAPADLHTAPRLRSFRGEEALTRAIVAISAKRQPRVWLLQGHREMERTSSDPGRRIEAFAHALENLDYALAPLRLTDPAASTPPAPLGRHDVVVIAGPLDHLLPRELERLEKWLERGGRLLVFAEPVIRQRPGTTEAYFDPSGIERLLAPYGLALVPALVFDEASVTPLGIFSFRAPLGRGASARHPIVRPLRGQEVWFERAQPVAIDPEAAARRGGEVQPLIFTLPSAIAVQDLAAFQRSGDPRRAVARRGPICMAAAARAPVAASPGGQEGQTRIVVIGDATIVSDALAEPLPVHLDLALNAVGWLAERDETISIAAKPPAIIHLRLDHRAKLRLWLLSLLDLPALCLVLGFWIWRTRRLG